MYATFLKSLIVLSYAATIIMFSFEVFETDFDKTYRWLIEFAVIVVGIFGMQGIYKIDSYKFSTFMLTLLAVPLAVVLVACTIEFGFDHKVLLFIATHTLLIIGSLVIYLRIQYGKEMFPNTLKETFPGKKIYEVDEVQFVSKFSQMQTESGLSAFIDVVLQNTLDVERVVYVQFETHAKGLEFVQQVAVNVPAVSVGKLHIPVRIIAKPPATKAKMHLNIEAILSANGESGNRLRLRREKVIGEKSAGGLGALKTFLVPFPLNLLLGLAGNSTDNSVNLGAKLYYDGNDKIDEQVSLEHQWSIIWEPTVTELHRAMYEVQ